MSRVDVFTSITARYIPKARALAESLRKHQPDWTMHLLYVDSNHLDTVSADPLFKSVITPEMLIGSDWKRWMFRLRVVEACTAAKSKALKYLIEEQKAEKVIYLDPDIVAFDSLEPLSALLDRHPVVLTPHLTRPETDYQAVSDNEQACLKYGVFNLGFFAVANRGQGLAFADWWRERCDKLCLDDLPSGLFTDQKWCNLAPIFFDELYILRDPAYNVATWNLAQRNLALGKDGMLQVNGAPLRFYHFSGYDAGSGRTMAHKYSKAGDVVRELWDWYDRTLDKFGQNEFGKCPWGYGWFEDGSPVLDKMRAVYRCRPDMQEIFKDPFCVTGLDGGFKAWFLAGNPDLNKASP